jgi:hypothetical protein
MMKMTKQHAPARIITRRDGQVSDEQDISAASQLQIRKKHLPVSKRLFCPNRKEEEKGYFLTVSQRKDVRDLPSRRLSDQSTTCPTHSPPFVDENTKKMGENEEKTLKKKRQVLAFDDARPLNHGTKKNESRNDEKAPVFQLPEWPVVLRGVRSLKCRHDTPSPAVR